MSNEVKENPAKTADSVSTPIKPQKQAEPKELKTGIHSDGITADIVIDGKLKEIKKLKAGRFYKAQRVFAEIYGAASENIDRKKIPIKGIDMNDPKQFKKLTETVAKNMDPTSIQRLMSEVPEKMAEFVAICADMATSELLGNAYPGEIPIAFSICFELNNVIENLKNLGAPMRTLGAGVNK